MGEKHLIKTHLILTYWLPIEVLERKLYTNLGNIWNWDCFMGIFKSKTRTEERKWKNIHDRFWSFDRTLLIDLTDLGIASNLTNWQKTRANQGKAHYICERPEPLKPRKSQLLLRPLHRLPPSHCSFHGPYPLRYRINHFLHQSPVDANVLHAYPLLRSVWNILLQHAGYDQGNAAVLHDRPFNRHSWVWCDHDWALNEEVHPLHVDIHSFSMLLWTRQCD